MQHVAGTIGGSSYGVAKGVRLLGVKVRELSFGQLGWFRNWAHKTTLGIEQQR